MANSKTLSYTVTKLEGIRKVKKVRQDKDGTIKRNKKGLMEFIDVDVEGGFMIKNSRGDTVIVNTEEELRALGILDYTKKVMVDEDGEPV